MRSDFNKLITENPRNLHGVHFREYRRSAKNAVFDEDARGGKESMMKQRREARGQRKSFGENLAPLQRFLDKNVGKQWDKIHSLICETFDPRSVINNHILQHVFQDFVEINTKMVNGKVCVLNNWAHDGRPISYVGRYPNQQKVENTGYYDKRWVPVKESGSGFYVHPVTGCMLKVPERSRRTQARERAKQHDREAAKLFREVSKYEELRLEDGIWWLYTMKDRPPAEKVFGIPGYSDYQFKCLRPEEQRHRGVHYMREAKVGEVRRQGSPSTPSNKRFYYATRQQASSKLLRKFGLEGTAQFKEDESKLSSRLLSKYR